MLPPAQLLQLTAVYDELGECEVAKATWHKLFSLPWVPSVAVAVTAGCAHFLRMEAQGGLGLLQDLLHSAACGAICQFQVTHARTAFLFGGVSSCVVALLHRLSVDGSSSLGLRVQAVVGTCMH